MLQFNTNDPAGLLKAFRKAIDDKKIVTWSYDNGGNFTHTPEQWARFGWMRPKVELGNLTFNFLGNSKIATSKEVYAIYHGRLSESLLAHFDNSFTMATSTALPAGADNIMTKSAA
jgi:hypothetical protein